MARLDLILDDILEKKFRKAAQEWGNYKKGALSDAFEEAVIDWLKKISHTTITKEFKSQPRRKFTR